MSFYDNQSDIVAKMKAEASLLRLTNEDLSKQVEGLQTSRLNEVEELAYLRWVNSCLRNELKNNTCSVSDLDKTSSPQSVASSNGDCVSVSSFSFSDQSNRYSNCGSTNRFNLVKKSKKWPITSDHLSQVECPNSLIEKNWIEQEIGGSCTTRRHSISGSNSSEEEIVVVSKRRQSNCFDSFECLKEIEKESVPIQQSGLERTQYFGNCQEANKLLACFDVEKRALRIPNPPPRPSCSISSITKVESSSAQVALAPPPPPPPPPPPMNFASRSNTTTVKRAPQVVELYHSLMKRDSRRDSTNGGLPDASDVADVRSSMIGEIENRSSHLLAVSSFIPCVQVVNFIFFMTNFF